MAQWLDRIKFGSGASGSPAVSGTINSYASCTGTATQLSLTTALAASLGDMILVHQTQGTGAGQWEINYVLADAGATLTLAYPLAYTYGTGAQAVLMPQYIAGTLSGAVTATSWGGSVGGIIALMCNGELTISGSLTINGANGSVGGNATAGATGGGFRGGANRVSSSYPAIAYQGEGYAATGSQTTVANGNGGGGGRINTNCAWGGGGGGGGAAGQIGAPDGATNGVAGAAGGTGGSTDLTSMSLGGGGGGGVREAGTDSGSGASGAGMCFIFSKSLVLTGTITLQGGLGGDGTYNNNGGSGGGGSAFIACESATLGTNKITALGGAALNSYGAGGAGYIRLNYGSSYTGTTNPTLSAVQDRQYMSQVYTSMI